MIKKIKKFLKRGKALNFGRAWKAGDFGRRVPTVGMILILILGLIASLFSFPLHIKESKADGTIYYMATTGNDTTGDGTIDLPWKTLTKANTMLAPGDTLYIRGGTYTGAGVRMLAWTASGTEGNIITIANYPGETPIFDMVDESSFFRTATDGSFTGYLTIDGLEITNCVWNPISIWDGSYITIKNCYFHDNTCTSTGAISTAAGFQATDHVIIENNHFKDNGGPTTNSLNHAIYVGDLSSYVTVRHNLFEKVAGWSVHAYDADISHISVYYNIFIFTEEFGAGGIVIDMSAFPLADAEIYNNVFYNPGATATTYPMSNIQSDYSTCTVKNNIFYGPVPPNGYLWEQAHGSFTADYNCYYSGAVDADDTGGHSFSADPLFVSPTTGDFRLQAASPCINAGVDVGLTEDYERNPVPKCSNSNPDIGAYEYQETCLGGGFPSGYSDPPIPGLNGFRCIINNNDTSTNNREVTLTLEAGSNVKYAAVSEKPDLSGAGFEAFEPEVFIKPFSLSLGDGLKKVYAQFLTAYNRFSEIVYDEIVLDTSVPGQTTQQEQQQQTTQQEQQQQTTQQEQQIPTSNLLRALSDTKVYQIINNLRHWIPNPNVFNSYGFDWQKIQEVNPIDLDDYLRAKLLRPEGDIRVYYLTEVGMIRHIPSPEVFNSYNNKWEDIIEVSQTEINSYPVNNLIRLENGIKVFKLENYTKTWIKTAEAFNRLKYDWTKIAPVNQTELDYYSEGKAIE